MKEENGEDASINNLLSLLKIGRAISGSWIEIQDNSCIFFPLLFIDIVCFVKLRSCSSAETKHVDKQFLLEEQCDNAIVETKLLKD